NRYSLLNDNLFLEKFVIRDSKGFLTHLERELRPIPKFYALMTPININDGTVITKDDNTIIDIETSNSFMQDEVKKPDLNSLDPESLIGTSSKESSTSLPLTPIKAGSLSMILNFDNSSLKPAPAASMPISLP
ncbi:4392_t:CDS:2, partial [Racocetra fulgida]